MDANDIQAMEQDFTEFMLLNKLLQILVRRRDDSYIDLDGGMSANAIELAIGKHAQQACLRLSWHVADLIQKQAATIGLFEASGALGGAPVNAPFSWPNNSDSINSLGIAATFRGTKALPLRGLC